MSEAATAIGALPRVERKAGLVRGGLLWAFRRVIGIYFREIEAAGNVPTPETGGRLFVSNHVNALVDPILVLTAAPCPISPVAKSTLWKVPGLRWLLDAVDAVPIVRRRDDPTKQTGSNDEVFDRVAAWLAGGQNILIFPEGTSHNEPQLLELKTGAARMIARAHARGGAELTFQSVALEFDDREMFRSRCLLLYGPVRRVDELVGEGDALVAKITEQLRDDLSELLVEGTTWPERLLIARVAEMLANDSGERSLENWNSIGRQVEAARKALRGVGDETVARVERAVTEYYDQLGQEGLVDEQLAVGGDPGPSRSLGAALALLLPLALVGMVLYAVPYQLPRFVARRAKDDRDEVSTLKLATGMVVYPVWSAALIATAFATLPLPAALAAAAIALVSPFATLAWLDVTPRLRRSVRFASRSARIEELRRKRSEALALIQATREKLRL